MTSKMPESVTKNKNNVTTMKGSSILSYMDKQDIDNISKLYNTIGQKSEFEISLFNTKESELSYDKYMKLINYLSTRYKTNKTTMKIERSYVLDINYSKLDEATSEFVTYRISLSTMPIINKYIEMLHKRNNHIIINVIVGILLDEKNTTDHQFITLLKKSKKKSNMIDIPDFDMRIRLADEEAVTNTEKKMLTKLTNIDMNHITYRFKDRISLIIGVDTNADIRIDLTNVKMSSVINFIQKASSKYELELELVNKSNKLTDIYLKMMYTEIDKLLKIMQQNNYIISNSLSKKVIAYYENQLGIEKSKTNLNGRQPISLEIQHITDILPNKYAVTDKADGERYFLIIYENEVYLISNNLHVTYTGIILKDSKYNGSILDGELIFISKYQKYMFMIFDCLFCGDEDQRQVISLTMRHAKADEIIEKCFVLDTQKGFIHKLYSDKNGKYDTPNIVKFYDTEMNTFLNSLENDIHIGKHPLVRRKMFLKAHGTADNEIYKYALQLWNKFIYDTTVTCQYKLDGLVFHPLEQKYTTSIKESKLSEYKWKPPEKNSIDFYVKFESDTKTGKVLTAYDNSIDELISNKLFKICNLHVGRSVDNTETPVLFQEESKKYIAYLFLDKGEARDQEGHIIQDNTVVEFYYDSSADNIDERTRWMPLRTRYDKTESVQKYKKKYGNYIDVANNVWRTICNPILIDDFDKLANNNIYRQHNDFLRSRIDHSIILSEYKQNAYYQKHNKLAKPLRDYHNWLKDFLIFTYCSAKYTATPENKFDVLDIACGQGGDNLKYYHATIKSLVGVDISYHNLISATNGALSRYKQMSRKYPNFPQMTFIHADASALFTYDDQVRALGTVLPDNKANFDKYFPINAKNIKGTYHTFDRINCFFAIHFFLENEIKWANFCTNINNHLKEGGYMCISTFDGDKIVDLFNKLATNNNTVDKNHYTGYYTDSNGQKSMLFDIIKKYNENEKVTLGFAIDVHSAWINAEESYDTEYLVSSEYIIKQLKERCNLDLVDTDLFKNQFEIHKDYFDYIVPNEEKVETRNFLTKVGSYYDINELNKECFKLTELNRYYVFRKASSTIDQTGGSDSESKSESEKEFTYTDSEVKVPDNTNDSGSDFNYSETITPEISIPTIKRTKVSKKEITKVSKNKKETTKVSKKKKETTKVSKKKKDTKSSSKKKATKVIKKQKGGDDSTLTDIIKDEHTILEFINDGYTFCKSIYTAIDQLRLFETDFDNINKINDTSIISENIKNFMKNLNKPTTNIQYNLIIINVTDSGSKIESYIHNNSCQFIVLYTSNNSYGLVNNNNNNNKLYDSDSEFIKNLLNLPK